MLHIVIHLIRLLLRADSTDRENYSISPVFHQKEIIRNFIGLLTQLRNGQLDYNAANDQVRYIKMAAKKVREEFDNYPDKVTAVDEITANIDLGNFDWKLIQKHLKVIKKGY